MRNRIITLIIGLFAILTISAKATVIVTYAEKAGSETSSIVNSSVLTFDNIATGYHTSTNDTALTWAGVGTFDNLNIVSAGPYGGANNTNYMVVGVDVNTKSTLTLNTPSSYFGFWWSAGDKENVLDFYSGANGTGNLVAQFTTTNLLKTLPKSYYGNPNSGYNEGKDAGEPFAFINFFGTTDTSWKSIVIKNSLATGFEADNFTSRVEAYNVNTDGTLPGVIFETINGTQESYIAQTPEPNVTIALLMFGGLNLGFPILQKFKNYKK